MDLITAKFAKLGVDNAPGQELNQAAVALPLVGENLPGVRVDFSHGDVNAHPPIPGSIDHFIKGFEEGAAQAYTEYAGRKAIREDLADKLSAFTGSPVDAADIILTSGTQGALFLAIGSTVARGDKVAIVEPDYFANRKLVEFFDGELVPIYMDWKAHEEDRKSGIDLDGLEAAFKSGVKVFLYSNPNNPTGVIYSHDEVAAIGALAKKHHVTVIADELYSRQIFSGNSYVHLRSLSERPDDLITIMGPSKTESLSGYRLGVAFGSDHLIHRMEKLQAITNLRCAGYNQSVFRLWFNEPKGWMENRVEDHEQICTDIMKVLAKHEGVYARPTMGGSYLFVETPKLTVDGETFVKIVRAQADVILTPGTEFGPQFTHHFRINFSQDHDAAVAAMERVCTLIERYRA